MKINKLLAMLALGGTLTLSAGSVFADECDYRTTSSGSFYGGMMSDMGLVECLRGPLGSLPAEGEKVAPGFLIYKGEPDSPQNADDVAGLFADLVDELALDVGSTTPAILSQIFPAS